MDDRTPTGPSGHLSAIEQARLARYDKILVRLCYTGVALLYVSGALSSLALLKKIVEENGPMATVYLGVAMAFFAAAEKARRGAVRLRRTGEATAPA